MSEDINSYSRRQIRHNFSVVLGSDSEFEIKNVCMEN